MASAASVTVTASYCSVVGACVSPGLARVTVGFLLILQFVKKSACLERASLGYVASGRLRDVRGRPGRGGARTRGWAHFGVSSKCPPYLKINFEYGSEIAVLRIQPLYSEFNLSTKYFE